MRNSAYNHARNNTQLNHGPNCRCSYCRKNKADSVMEFELDFLEEGLNSSNDFFELELSGLAITSAVAYNRKKAKSIGWYNHFDDIVALVLKLNFSPNEEIFAQKVADWQSKNGLDDDGKIGPSTWNKMKLVLRISNRPLTTWVTGIDVSKWQGKVDWKKVAAAGHKFAFIKATEGVGFVDPRFHENWKACQAAGMIRGAYHFARVSRPIDMDAVAEAEHFSTTVGKLGPGDLPLVLDIEWDKRAKGIKPKEIVRWCGNFLETVHRLSKKKPIVYTGRNFWRWKLAKTQALSSYVLWQVYYSSKAKAPLSIDGWPATFWQWSHKRPVSGVKTKKVDENRFLGTHARLKKFAGL